MTPDILRFSGISPRTRSALERAGATVLRERGAWLAEMPAGADWGLGLLALDRRGRPMAVRKQVGFRSTVFHWRRQIGMCVLVCDEREFLWHWRDRACPTAMPF